jgi:hypothetical protein
VSPLKAGLSSGTDTDSIEGLLQGLAVVGLLQDALQGRRAKLGRPIGVAPGQGFQQLGELSAMGGLPVARASSNLHGNPEMRRHAAR